MNLFEKYGIKEVADVVFYSMNQIGDGKIVYTPVLYLDTLKVSTIEKSADSSFATGGLKNKQLIKWNYGKTLKLTLEDALFSPASMSLIWGGKLNSKLSTFTSIVTKVNCANDYGRLRYSTKSYPSPALTEEEWNTVYKVLGVLLGLESIPQDYTGKNWYCDDEYESTLSDELKDFYSNRYANRPTQIGNEYTCKYDKDNFGSLYFDVPYANISGGVIEGLENNGNKYDPESADGMVAGQEGFYFAKALPEAVIVKIRQEIRNLSEIGEIDTSINTVQTVDRWEKCIVTNKDGLVINTRTQLDNLFRYYAGDQNSSYVIYYDAKTLLPLVYAKDGQIQNAESFKIKLGTVYYKWSRTVKYDEYNEDTLGHSFVIDADTFPDDYKIVGETYIRNQKTGKDQRYQIVIYKANITSNTSITLQADGEPTTFTMEVDVLAPPNDILMELIQLDVEEDKVEGGTRIKPQKKNYSFTSAQILAEEPLPVLDNLEIY